MQIDSSLIPPLLPLFFTLKGSLNYSYLPPGVELDEKGEKSASLEKNLVRASLLFFFSPSLAPRGKLFFLGWWWAKRGGKLDGPSPLSLAGCVCQRGFSPSLTSNLPSSSSSSSLSSPLWRRFHPPDCCSPLLPHRNRLQGFAAGGC